MKRIFLTFSLIYLLISSVFFINNAIALESFNTIDSIQAKSGTALNDVESENYFLNAIPKNKPVKWHSFPIKVYISKNNFFVKSKDAFNEWQNLSNNTVSFSFVDNKEGADIIVYFNDIFENAANKEAFLGGKNELFFKGNNIVHSDIYILEKNPINSKIFSQSHIYVILLHEIGHAIGIVGHSQFSGDIMYASPNSSHGSLSNRDINTLKMLYAKDDIVDTSSVFEFKLKEAQFAVKNFPNYESAWVKLGDIHRNSGYYKESLKYYKKAIEVNHEYYQSRYPMAISYYYLKKYDNSYKCLTYLLKNEPDNIMYIHAFAKVCSKLNKNKEAIVYLNSYTAKNKDTAGGDVVKEIKKVLGI